MYIRCDNLRNDFEQPIRKGDRDNIEKNYGESERLFNLCKISEKVDEVKKIIAEHPSKIIDVDNEYTSMPFPTTQTTETFSTIENNKVRQILMLLLKIILVFYILCVIFSKKAKNIIKIIKKHLNFKK
jgi:hypothetical protein